MRFYLFLLKTRTQNNDRHPKGGIKKLGIIMKYNQEIHIINTNITLVTDCKFQAKGSQRREGRANGGEHLNSHAKLHSFCSVPPTKSALSRPPSNHLLARTSLATGTRATWSGRRGRETEKEARSESRAGDGGGGEVKQNESWRRGHKLQWKAT